MSEEGGSNTTGWMGITQLLHYVQGEKLRVGERWEWGRSVRKLAERMTRACLMERGSKEWLDGGRGAGEESMLV